MVGGAARPGGKPVVGLARGDFQTRLDGTFAIDTDGRVSLPMVGDVPAEGRSTAELGAAIAALFQGKFGTLTAPSASVEIIEYRPFYIVGVVDRPGSYPFRPGMTVLHALSIAGGLYRRPDMELGRYQRDLMSATGDTASRRSTATSCSRGSPGSRPSSPAGTRSRSPTSSRPARATRGSCGRWPTRPSF